MQSEKFTTTSMSISAILELIKANDIAIPEIQRPFVWKSKQCETKVIKCGSITDIEELKRNLEVNCVPEDVFDMDHSRYAEFLEKRRVLMAQKIKKYYYGL